MTTVTYLLGWRVTWAAFNNLFNHCRVSCKLFIVVSVREIYQSIGFYMHQAGWWVMLHVALDRVNIWLNTTEMYISGTCVNNETALGLKPVQFATGIVDKLVLHLIF